VEVEVGDAIAEPSDFENYLTARFHLWTVLGGTPVRAAAHHPPWPLRRATVTRLDTELLTAAGLTHPHTDPETHYSDGVTVKIGLPRR
jgi:uncharacterized protein YqjF (DUF2071 family)